MQHTLVKYCINKGKEKELCFIQKNIFFKEIGKMIQNKVRDMKSIKTKIFIKAFSMLAKLKDLELIHGLMEINILDTGKMG